MSEVKRLYTCVVCGRSWSKVQSLRAHVKVHKGVEWARLTVRVPKDFLERVNALCEAHKLTSCHLVYSLLGAVLAGEKTGVVDLDRLLGSNPLVVKLDQHFLGVPRSKAKYEVPAPESVIAGDAEPVTGFGSQGARRRWRSLPPLDPDWLKRQLEVK